MKFVNKKKLTKAPNHYLNFTDSGTATIEIYLQYVVKKIAWIPRLEKYKKLLNNLKVIELLLGQIL